MCEEVWKRYNVCEHLIFNTFWACDDWSEAHPGPNVEGSEVCANYNAGVVHETIDEPGRCTDCAHLPTPPDSSDSE